MTANAMSGDREKCLQAGMNDHVAKPVDMNNLYQVLSQWVKAKKREIPEHLRIDKNADKTTAHETTTNEAEIPAMPDINIEAALSRLNGQTKLYRKLLLKFTDNQAAVITDIKTALDKKDTESAVRLAHTLKGMAGTIGAGKLQVLAGKLETALNHVEEQPIDDLITQTQDRLENTINTIKIAIVQVKSTTKLAIISQQTLMQELSLIAEGIENFDSTTEEAVENLLKKLDDPELCASLEKLKQHLSAYDFDMAETCVAALIATQNRD
jgi:HPt (histidine-containing phosphotransfer) domain-containing protein